VPNDQVNAPEVNRRGGCCADWPKPCTYHDGWEDGYEAARIEFPPVLSPGGRPDRRWDTDSQRWIYPGEREYEGPQ
jgi:hypothetical protein